MLTDPNGVRPDFWMAWQFAKWSSHVAGGVSPSLLKMSFL